MKQRTYKMVYSRTLNFPEGLWKAVHEITDNAPGESFQGWVFEAMKLRLAGMLPPVKTDYE